MLSHARAMAAEVVISPAKSIKSLRGDSAYLEWRWRSKKSYRESISLRG